MLLANEKMTTYLDVLEQISSSPGMDFCNALCLLVLYEMAFRASNEN